MIDHMKLVGIGEYSIPASYLSALVTFSAGYGISLTELLVDSGINIEDLLNQPTHVRIRSYNSALGNLIRLSGDDNVAWEYGKQLSYHDHGLLGIASQCASNLKNLLEILRNYIATQTGYSLQVDTTDSGRYLFVQICVTPPDVPDKIVQFHTISVLTNFLWIARRLTNTVTEGLNEEIHLAWPADAEGLRSTALPDQVNVKHSKPHTGLRYKKSLLQTPVKSHNRRLRDLMIRQCELMLDKPCTKASATERVAWALEACDAVAPTLRDVALLLNSSPATLKRQLQREGTSYGFLKNKDRFGRVKRLLVDTDLSLRAIANQVGYSDASNLSKAFRSRFGTTPKQFRERAHT